MKHTPPIHILFYLIYYYHLNLQESQTFLVDFAIPLDKNDKENICITAKILYNEEEIDF